MSDPILPTVAVTVEIDPLKLVEGMSRAELTTLIDAIINQGSLSIFDVREIVNAPSYND